jgi:hypothetical protein
MVISLRQIFRYVMLPGRRVGDQWAEMSLPYALIGGDRR